MKNQYIGDVKDYGKYGLIRFLEANGVKFGINWYATANDSTNEGNDIAYLNKPPQRTYDPWLYDYLGSLINEDNKRIEKIEDSDVFATKIFYNVELHSHDVSVNMRREVREKWHRTALLIFREVEMVFFDPDTGILPKSLTTGRQYAEKYVSPQELRDYYVMGKDLLCFCYRNHNIAKDKYWKNICELVDKVDSEIEPFALVFRGQVYYTFMVHKEHRKKFLELSSIFLNTDWKEYFGDVAVE